MDVAVPFFSQLTLRTEQTVPFVPGTASCPVLTLHPQGRNLLLQIDKLQSFKRNAASHRGQCWWSFNEPCRAPPVLCGETGPLFLLVCD